MSADKGASSGTAAFSLDRESFDHPYSSASPGRGGILGLLGQASTDPLEALFRRHRPQGRLPGWVSCAARRQPGRLGLTRCKSVFCPACHYARRTVEARRLQRVFVGAEDAGFGQWFMTVTLAHTDGVPLADCIAACNCAWQSARSGSAYARLRTRHGLIGVVNCLDITHGASGWHPHYHCNVIAEDRAAARHCAEVLGRRYEAALLRKGCAVVERTVDARLVHDAAGLARYMAKPWTRASAGASSTLFDLLRAALEGCWRPAELFIEAAEACAGKRWGVVPSNVAKAVFEQAETHFRSQNSLGPRHSLGKQR